MSNIITSFRQMLKEKGIEEKDALKKLNKVTGLSVDIYRLTDWELKREGREARSKVLRYMLKEVEVWGIEQSIRKVNELSAKQINAADAEAVIVCFNQLVRLP